MDLLDCYQSNAINRLRYVTTRFQEALLHLGKDYPLGYDYFRTRLKKAFLKNKDVTDPEQVKKMISHGEYVVKELEALYMLKKYRTLKRRYENQDKPDEQPAPPRTKRKRQ